MGKISVPAAPKVFTINMGKFLGADLTNASSYIDIRRSPDCPNIIRESAGKVRKWIGWHTVKQYDGRINGFHTFSDETGDTLLIHAGTKLYKGDTVICEGLADRRSVSRQLNKKLIIADGGTLKMYWNDNGTFKCEPVSQHAYVPTIVISRSPTGGGQTYESINLLGTQRKDSFLGTASDTVYQLSATEITSVDKVEKLNANAGYDVITDFTVNTVEGKVIFSTPPGVSPITGQDNIIITYSKITSGYADKINKCDIIALYGVNGAMDRIFLAGDEEYPNRDYYCGLDDPTYWGDVQYSVIGQDNSKIMGYSVINDILATHINRSDNDTNIVLRKGSLLDDGTARFTLNGAYQGTGAISKWAFGVLETEPLFLTEHGIMAVTPSDVLGERYAQLRSYFLNGLLLKQDLKEAVSCTYDRFYMLAVGGYIFALDGTQASVEENEPYSKRQYEGFYRTNVDARVITNINETLTFGTNDGRVCEFYKDYDDIHCFADDGAIPINAYWTTPDLYGNTFYYKKRFKTMSILVGSAIKTSVQVKAVYDDDEDIVIDYTNDLRTLSFKNMIFSKLCFNAQRYARIIKEKISVKPDNKMAKFIFQNDKQNEPFSIYEATIEYTMSK